MIFKYNVSTSVPMFVGTITTLHYPNLMPTMFYDVSTSEMKKILIMYDSFLWFFLSWFNSSGDNNLKTIDSFIKYQAIWSKWRNMDTYVCEFFALNKQ